MFRHAKKYDVLLVTTNAYVKLSGLLVMGRGAAYQMTQEYPGSQAEFGMLVALHNSLRPNTPYGLIMSERWRDPFLGIFQVKRYFKDVADLGLIEYSTRLLNLEARRHPEDRYALNYPGIGNGHRAMAQVQPLLDPLPDNVEVWTR
jgi:hypothetical protein